MKKCQVSPVVDVTNWGSLVAIFGVVLVDAPAFETQFVFLKSFLSAKVSPRNLLHSFRVSFFVPWKRQFI